MKTNVSEDNFVQAFQSLRPDNFSFAGLRALYQNLIELETDAGDEMELDVIALCCGFTEWENLKEFQDNHDANDYPDLDAINGATIVIPIDDERFITGVF